MPIIQTVVVPAATFALAVYGAGLATYSAIQTRRKDRRSIKVGMNTAMYAFGAQLGPPMISIEVVNDGHRSMVVDAPQMMVASEPSKVIALVGADGIRDFPKRLEDGEVVGLRIEYREIAKTLMQAGHVGRVKLLAICKDSTGQQYKSEAWSVDMREWLAMAA